MDASVLKHPRIAGIVNSLVDAGGGRLTYDTGCGGREMLIAASTQLAAKDNAPLTVVEHRILHFEVRTLISELQPDVRSTVLSADEAALQPDGSITGVLAVHADVLRDPDVRRPLLAMAHSADRLVVARHDDSDTTLDDLATPGPVLRYHDLMPGPRPGVREQRQAATRPGVQALHGLVDPRWTAPAMEERKQRIIEQFNQAAQHRGGRSYETFAELMQNVDPDEVRRRIEWMLDQQGQRAGPPAPRPAHEHGQEQSEAHQQQQGPQPQGPGRT